MKRTRSTPFFDRFISWSLDHPLSAIIRYLAATLLIVLVAVLRATFVTSALPWLLFIPAILAIALAFGEGVGIFASLLAAVLAGFSIGNPAQPWFLTEAQWSGTTLFVVIAVALTFFAGELRAAFRRARNLMTEALDREAFLSGVLASSTDCIKVMDLDGRLTFMSEGGMQVMEISDFNAIKGCPWPDFWQDAGNSDAREAIDRARAGQSSHFVGQADTFLGTTKWWDVSVSPILGADGMPARLLSVSRDTSALMEAQEQQRLLNGELSHRLKNVLAVVQSIASQTFRQVTGAEAASEAFSSRLAALGQATDVLTSTAWQSATLQDVIRAGLTSVDVMKERISLSGPDIKLDSQVALALTLTLHELATNACKYGALSNERGVVELSWSYESGEERQDGRFLFQWQEVGGPVVTPPARRGFGSKMIERSLRPYFRGETSLRFDREGVIFKIDAPLPKAATPAGETDGKSPSLLR